MAFSVHWSILLLILLQRVHIARSAERCNSQRDSVCLLSVRHVPVLCPGEWRYDRAVDDLERRGKLVLLNNRKSNMSFQLVPKSVTLNDLERRNGHYFALFRRIR